MWSRLLKDDLGISRSRLRIARHDHKNCKSLFLTTLDHVCKTDLMNMTLIVVDICYKVFYCNFEPIYTLYMHVCCIPGACSLPILTHTMILLMGEIIVLTPTEGRGGNTWKHVIRDEIVLKLGKRPQFVSTWYIWNKSTIKLRGFRMKTH